MLAKLLKTETGNIECTPFVLPSESDPVTEVFSAWEIMEDEPQPVRIANVLIPQIEDVVQAEREKAEAQVAGILNAARDQANKMIMDAEAEVQRIEHDAMERGMLDARALVQAEINQAVEDLRSQLARSLDEVAALRLTLAERVEKELVQLSLEIAKKIVQREVLVDPDIPLTMARLALSRTHRASATVRLHPDDFEYVNSRRDQLRAEGLIEIVADAGVSRGGCVIQSERGDVDARIEQQFANIEHGFLHPL